MTKTPGGEPPPEPLMEVGPMRMHVTQAGHILDLEAWVVELIGGLSGNLDQDNFVDMDLVNALILCRSKGVPCTLAMYQDAAEKLRAKAALPAHEPEPEPPTWEAPSARALHQKKALTLPK